MKLGEAVIHVSRGRLGLCVAMNNEKICGLVTDGDIRRAMEKSQDVFFKRTVADIMSVHPKCVGPETKITEIERIFQQFKIHSVLVVDADNHLLGIVDSFRAMI